MLCNFVCIYPSLSPAEAQEETIEQRFAVFQDQMAEMGKNLAEKAKTTFEQFQTSDLAVKSQ